MRLRTFQDETELARLFGRVIRPDLVVVDGGARNGTRELPRLAPWIVAHGFEPSGAEYQPLERDAARSHYRKITYHPVALMAEGGEATLHVSKRPGATSTLQPNAELLSHFAADNWSQMAEIVGRERVPAVTLGDFMRSERLQHIDYLKLDTQGNELDIIKSSGGLLRSISVIKTEVEMIPIYRDQPLFGDVASFLAESGFELIDLQWTDPCRRYHFSPSLERSAYRLVWADAVFAYRPSGAGTRKLEQALVLAELGYTDLALYILSWVDSVDPGAIGRLIEIYQLRRPPASGSGWKRALARLLPDEWIEASRLVRRRQPKEVDRVPDTTGLKT